MTEGRLQERLAELGAKLSQAGLQISDGKTINYGRQLQVADSAHKLTINIYSGKKGISIVVGGSASPLKEKVQALVTGSCQSLVPENGCAQTGKTFAGRPPGFETVVDFDNRWIGADESGKGDFFGPLVTAAVLVDGTVAARLAACGVRDSKTLSNEKNKALAAQIRQICPAAYVEKIFEPVRYNELYKALQANGQNLNHLLAWGHAQTLEELLGWQQCKFALIDQFAAEHYMQEQLLPAGRQLTLVQRHRAEANVAVAAASILARDCFLAKMEEMAAEFDMVFPRGAVEVLFAARKFAQRYGQEALRKVCKTHFRTYKQI